MLLHLIPLAVLSAITSPTAIAAVLLILARPHPGRLLGAYVAGSFAASVLVGVAIIAGLAATSAFAPHRHTSLPIFDLAIGALILLSAAWLHSERSAEVRRRAAERLARRKAHKSAARGDRPSTTTRILARGSIGLIAAIGVAMHLPGLLYLAGLGEIAHAQLSNVDAVILVVLFNVVMLAPIELPLLGFVAAPERTQQVVAAVDTFIKQHRREGMLLVSVLAGGYLVVTGIVGLISGR